MKKLILGFYSKILFIIIYIFGLIGGLSIKESYSALNIGGVIPGPHYDSKKVIDFHTVVIVDTILYTLFAISGVLFFYGLQKYFVAGKDKLMKKKGKKMMIISGILFVCFVVIYFSYESVINYYINIGRNLSPYD